VLSSGSWHDCLRMHFFREAERKRIERTNPNPKMPLVRFVGDTWRTGGVLALSRAFGDAYLKVTRAVLIRVVTKQVLTSTTRQRGMCEDGVHDHSILL
jgi:Protein phosphatase 2C